MVAHQAVDAIDTQHRRVLRPQAQGPERVGAAVDHVAEEDQAPRTRALGRRDRVQQGRELARAAMHVADREHALARDVEPGGVPVRDRDRDRVAGHQSVSIGNAGSLAHSPIEPS